MSILFISDLHLDPSNTHTAQLFFDFMSQHAITAERLYILGDLFEAWIGDDHRSTFNQAVKQAISTLARRIPVYFLRGNRDFLIGSTFIQETGCILLPDEIVIDLYGTPTLLLHGDTLCIDDSAYQKARLKMHDPKFQQSVLSKPLFLRKLFAAYYRYKSHRHKYNSDVKIMDANMQEICRVMDKHQVSLLIHGHTHRPNSHEFTSQGKAKQRIVLSDWSREKGNYLICREDGTKELIYFTLE